MAHTLGMRSSGTVRRVGTERLRHGSDRSKRHMVLPAKGSPLRHFRPMTTRGTSNSDYDAYRAIHLTDRVTLSQASPRGKAGLKRAARVLSLGLSCYAHPRRSYDRLRVPPLPWAVPLSLSEKCAPEAGHLFARETLACR